MSKILKYPFKEAIQCKPLDIPNDLECVGVTINLSAEMSFNVIVLYRPPSENYMFFDNLFVILKNVMVKKCY